MRILLFAVVGIAIFGNHCTAQILAFSGADGPGGSATGGRGGDVYHVTNLEFDLNSVIPGSLKYGLSTAPSGGRTIVFDVGGTIFHDGGGPGWWFRCGADNITVAGQTAPGGITIAGVGSKWTGDNNILRNITVRPNKDPVHPDYYSYDAFALQVKNSIVDHVSATWHTDEGISLTDSGQNSTVQYATIGEGLNYEGHSYGSIIATEVDGTNYSYHHNLYAHHKSRLPRLGSEMGSTGAVLNWSNNLIYNWQSDAGYSGGGQPSSTNFLSNYYVKGYNNGSTIFDSANATTRIYQNGNYYDGDKDGVLDGTLVGWEAFDGSETKLSTPLTVAGGGVVDTAEEGLDRVLEYSGANWQHRNSIDQRIVDSAKDGSGRIINDLTSGTQAAEWAILLAERPDGLGNAPYNRPAGFDTDQDGMPDTWETAHNLNPNSADNNGDFDTDGYTNIEEYINELTEWPAPQPVVFNAATNNRYAQITNWDITWQPSKFDEAQINSGTVTVDAVGQHAGTLKLGANPGDNATLNVTEGWLKVENSGIAAGTGEVIIGADPMATAALNLSGGELSVETLSKGANGSMNFTGGTLHADRVAFDLVNDGGVIAPGDSPGVTQILGNLTINSGSLAIELGGTTAGVDSDLLQVTGNAALAGSLDVSLLDGFALAPDMTFDILDIAGTHTGQFAGLSEGSFVGNFGANLFITYAAGDGNDVALYSLSVIAGDYDFDGDVDGADFLTWQRNPSVGNLADWQTNFGYNGATPAGIAVPEPSSLVLAMLLLTTAVATRTCGKPFFPAFLGQYLVSKKSAMRSISVWIR
jgi:hypothetical protein